ncbi:hypothetical protein THIAE_05990 [Thiomicrospira aerophila AL3]|uniref:LexA regulated protein n=1 Tax=Thiomicrospira aerophila AL3 TaxID=717772 RepID=W0DZK2_9GAMM|nr:hypothetical protein [Thiomicrospira aerophila]AHF02276.1 hypothetical protein THIAE_05990 [Thiomicrospira aerophila AL3]
MKDDADAFTQELRLKFGAKSNSERQREYRRRQLESNLTQRLDLRIDAGVYKQLNELAQRKGLTKREILEQLIKSGRACK